MINTNKKAFTLVELLIAMSLIAIISVMLIPNIAQSGEKELLATQIKKVNGDLQQAVLLVMAQNQGTLTGFCSGNNGNACFIKELSRYLEYKAVFDSTDLPDVNGNPPNNNDENQPKQTVAYDGFCNRELIYISGKEVTTPFNSQDCTDGNFNAVHLKNGATVSARFDANCNGITNDNKDILTGFNTDNSYNLCGYIEVDVNSEKGPNTIGKDVHFFWIIDKDGLLPIGEVDAAICNNCTDANAECMGCTARVLRMGRIDYY